MSYQDMIDNGWRKVGQRGGTYVVAVLFNVNTAETTTVCVRDYDYDDGSRDNDDWYYAEIDETARKAYNRKLGVIEEGDTVTVVKGRKIPHGYTGVVQRLRPIRDMYRREIDTYVVFADGKQTSVFNCQLA